jgi:hypothetical protein
MNMHQWGYTSLGLAADKGYYTVLTLLLDRGADIEAAPFVSYDPINCDCYISSLPVRRREILVKRK